MREISRQRPFYDASSALKPSYFNSKNQSAWSNGALRGRRGEGVISACIDIWGKLLGDAAAVSAMLDRLLHHGHVLKCGPRSWRTKTDLPPQEAAG